MSLTRKLHLVKALALSVLLCTMGTNVYAAGLEAPHNASSGIGCMNCHDLASSDANHVPLLDHTATGPDDTVNNNLCWSCHTDPGKVNPAHIITETHSSSALGTSIFGDFTIDCSVCHNQHVQETPGGNFVRSNIDLSRIQYSGTSFSKGGRRAVTYTGSTALVTATGDGICQVCHTLTAYYTNDGNGQGHNAGQKCTACHEHSSSFKPGADHSTFIVDDQSTPGGTFSCSGCHTNYPTAPESAHNDCNSCHASISPVVLNDSNFPNATAQPDWDGASMFANLGASAGGYDTSYGTSTRLLDTNGAGIADGGFIKIKCGFCHAAKPAALEASAPAPTHGGHAAGHFGFDSNCNDCHPGEVVKDVHANNCDVCHSGSTYNATTEKVGDTTNGVDGDATNANGAATAPSPFDPSVYTCTLCHDIADAAVNAASVGGIHHDNRNKNSLADPIDCTTRCHTVSGHEGNHTTMVAAGATGCDTSGCHDTNVGGATGAPINSTDMKIHDECLTCHAIALTPAANGILNSGPWTRGVTTLNDSTPLNTTDGGGDCSQCHTAWSFTSHSHTHNVTYTTPCDACHTGDVITATDAGQAPNQGTHQNDCSNCHNTTTGARIVGANGWGDATLNGGNGGNCKTCHSVYFDGHVHGTDTGYVSHGFGNSTGCDTCHNLDNSDGSQARNVINTPYVSSTNSEVHGALGCDTCHNTGTDGSLKAGAVPGATECVDCHTDTWETIHTTQANTIHTTGYTGNPYVTAYSACLNCHVDVNPNSNARIATSTPYVGSGEVHERNGCVTCHTGSNDGALQTVGAGTKADRIMDNGAGCADCHIWNTSWKDRHANAMDGTVPMVDHRTRVDGLATCVTCHDSTAADTTTILGKITVDGTPGNKVHDDCYDCHISLFGATLGQLKAVTATGGSSNIAKGDCGTCHGAIYFDNHTHHFTANNQVIYDSSVDRSQGADLASNACAECHQDKTGDTTTFATFDGIRMEHDIWDASKDATGGCTTCHDYATNGEKTGDPDTPLLATVVSRIGTDATTSCTQCHEPKLWSNATSTHGGHSDADFGWNESVDNCQDCHGAGAAAEAVVKDIHGNNCDLCHTGGVYNAGTNGAGPAANGVDGDAGLAEGAASATPKFNPAAYYCTTCHDPAGANVEASTIGGIHHDNKSGDTDCTTRCHTVSGHEGAHQTKISNAGGECSTCHTNTPASTATAPTSMVDHLVHDECFTCHQFAGTPDNAGELRAAYGRAQAIPAGGGDCQLCHTNMATITNANGTDYTTYGGDHHLHSYAQAGDCDHCHTDPRPATGWTAPTSNTGGYTMAAYPQQLVCIDCHTTGADGRTIYKNRIDNGTVEGYSERFDTTDPTASGNSGGIPLVQTAIHSLPGASAIAIANYGICLECHTDATKVGDLATLSIWHGRPVEQGDTGDPRHTNSSASNYYRQYRDFVICSRDLPTGSIQTLGRGVDTNGEGGAVPFALFFNYLSPNVTGRDYQGTSCEATWDGNPNWRGTYRNNRNIVTLQGPSGAYQSYMEVPVSATFNNFMGRADDATGNNQPWYGNSSAGTERVPFMHDDTVVPATPDRVIVTSAEVNASRDLVVTAANDDGCGALTVITQPDNTNRGTMTGTSPNCTKTVTGIIPVPSTVDVTTSNTNGTNVTGYPVVDNSCTATTVTITSPAGNVNWTPTAIGIGSLDTINVTTGNSVSGVDLDYNGSTYAMTGSGTSWSITQTGVPYAASLTAVTNDATYCGTSAAKTVNNNGDVVTVTRAEYGGSGQADTLEVDVTTTQSPATVTVTYNGTDYGMSGGPNSWTLVQPGLTYAATLDVTTSKFGQALNEPVSNLNNAAPTLSLSQPSGQTGQSLSAPVDITYSLADTDNVVTASFSLDTDTNSGNGTGSAITCTGGTGAGAEGAGVTCTWDASAIATGGNTYYVYATANDGVNPAVEAYSGSITFQSTPPFADWTESWTGVNIESAIQTTYTWVPGNGGTTNNGTGSCVPWWGEDTNATPSSTGPTTNPNPPYVYTEGSEIGTFECVLPEGEYVYLENATALDAGSYDFNLQFDYSCPSANTNTQLSVWVDDGTGTFVQDTVVATGGTNMPDTNPWNRANINLTSPTYSSNAMKIRISYVMDKTSGNGWNNDCAIDEITVNGTP